MPFTENIPDLLRGFAELFDHEELPIELTIKEQDTAGLSIEYADGKATISYGKPNDFYRAFTILRAKFLNGEKSFKLTENANFDRCGIMIDCSRNAVLKVETVKDIMRYMAKMGLNQLMLYTEDTYELDKYPYFGYLRGAYTKEEIKEIVTYGELFGIETIPCIQTLGHLGSTLKWGYAAPMRDTAGTLLCGEDATYEFIEEMVKTCRECYHTKRIHIGMDEAVDVGSGAYKRKHGDVPRIEILTAHLKRVMEILEKYDFEPMMWSDMFFRLGSGSEDYYVPEAKMPADLPDKIPEKMSMVYWDYYNISDNVYDGMIKAHQAMKREVIFAGGIWTWTGPAIHYRKTLETTHVALNSCIKHGVKNVFATMWGDNGAECGIYNTLLGLQLYAEYNYHGSDDMAHLSEMFRICTGFDAETFLAFGVDDYDDKRVTWYFSGTSKQMLFQDVLVGMYDRNFMNFDFKSHYKKALDRVNAVEDSEKIHDIVTCNKLIIKMLYEKCDLGIRMSKAYRDGDKAALSECADTLCVLLEDFKKFHAVQYDIWMKNNKPFGFEILDARYGGMEARFATAQRRIRDYLNGDLDRIDELAFEKLPVTCDDPGKANPFLIEYGFERIFSAND